MITPEVIARRGIVAAKVFASGGIENFIIERPHDLFAITGSGIILILLTAARS